MSVPYKILVVYFVSLSHLPVDPHILWHLPNLKFISSFRQYDAVKLDTFSITLLPSAYVVSTWNAVVFVFIVEIR
jgi:hypothetical protein